jgi:hypothetical protein
MLVDIAETKYKDNITFYDNMVFICNRYIRKRYDTSDIAEKVKDAVQNCYTAHLFGEGKSNLNVDKFNTTLIGSAYMNRIIALNKTDFYN